MEYKRPPMPYFMEYADVEDENEALSKDTERDYFRQLYPVTVKRYLRVIFEVLDRMDGKGSYIYDEYPDKISLERLAENILRFIPLEKNVLRETQSNLVKVLLYEEIIRRRNL